MFDKQKKDLVKKKQYDNFGFMSAIFLTPTAESFNRLQNYEDETPKKSIRILFWVQKVAIPSFKAFTFAHVSQYNKKNVYLIIP